MNKMIFLNRKVFFRNFVSGIIVWCGVVLCDFSAQAQGRDRNNILASNKIERSFSVKKHDALEIDNRHGDVHIETWDKNKIEIVIEINVWGNNQKRADALLADIDIEEKVSRGEIYFKTRVKRHQIKCNNHSGFEINYGVKMPKQNSLALSNKYGNVYLADLSGELELEIAYGKLKAEKLLGDSEIEIRYSSGEISELNNAEIVTAYTNRLDIEKVNNLELEARYGKITLGEVNLLEGEMKYFSLEAETVNQSLVLDCKYSKGEVDLLGPDFELVDVASAYGSFTFGLDEETAPFDFDIQVNYGGVKKMPKSFSFSEGIDKEAHNKKEDRKEGNCFPCVPSVDFSSKYKGSYKGGAKAEFTAYLSYGNLRFK